MASTLAICPECGERGRRVGGITVAKLVSTMSALSLVGQAMFCATESCEVVYFDSKGARVVKAALRVQVFQKESDLSRLVCYCFEHSVAEVLAASRSDESNEVVDSIMAACRAGLDRCEETNPQGRCCLGNVRAVAKAEVGVGSESCPSCEGS